MENTPENHSPSADPSTAPSSDIPKIKREYSFLNIPVAGTGLLSAILVIVLGWAFVYLTTSSFLGQVLSFASFVTPIFGVALVLGFTLAAVGPAFYIGLKRGWKTFLLILIAEFFWYIILLLASYPFAVKYGGHMMNGIY